MDEMILNLTAQIVSAHVQKNAIAPEQLPELIRQVHKTLSTVSHGPEEPEKAKPAVPVNRSVQDDHIVCLACGQSLKMLKRHLMTDHKLTIDQYKEKFGLPASYPVVAPDYARTRSDLAKKIGLGRRPAKPAKRGRRRAA
jgi:predicted transcriptional regulator